eukprot:1187160-Prorocentrum_minimum.AAC.6
MFHLFRATILVASGGVPAGWRPRVWANALGCPPRVPERQRGYLRSLLSEQKCDPRESLADTLAYADAAELSDRPSYFVFEDHLSSMLLAFNRDAEVGPSYFVFEDHLSSMLLAFNRDAEVGRGVATHYT